MDDMDRTAAHPDLPAGWLARSLDAAARERDRWPLARPPVQLLRGRQAEVCR